MTLQGKRAIITGGSRGLGYTIASRFLQQGAFVLICSRNAAELERAGIELNRLAPGRACTAVCDISSTGDVERLAEQARSSLGGADILVANAGVQGPMGQFGEVGWHEWTATIATNLIGSAYCCRAFLPLLQRSRVAKS